MTNRLTKFNEETGRYELRERAKTQAEFIAQRKAVIQRLGEFEDKASDVAEEIFAEIETKILANTSDISGWKHRVFAELKNKYTESEKNK